MSTVLKVAVSQRVDVWADRGERRDAVDQRLCQWLTASGCIQVPVPNIFMPKAKRDDNRMGLQDWLFAINPDAVLLSGGNDIGEVPERDSTEHCLLAYAKDQRLPTLGICRGMQMMAVWANGSLISVSGHVRTRHHLQIAAISGEWPDEVNSFHNVALADCPPGFVVMARAEDGTIEAMRHEVLPWEGWMWHPERESTFSPPDMNRFQALIQG